MKFSQKATTLFMAAMAVGTIGLSAASRSLTEQEEAARQRALEFFASHADKYKVNELTIEDAQGAGREYFVFKADDNSYYVVSSSAALPSVVAHTFALEAITDTTGTEGAFLKNYKEVVNNLSPSAALVDNQNVAISNWDCVVELTNVEVQPALLKTKWHQMAPYNNYCPGSGSNNRYLVGCVATAFAQVMNYFKYPSVGTGVFNPKYDNGWYIDKLPESYPGDRNLDLAHYPIKWDNMPEGQDRPLEEYTPSEIDAVARFCEEVGYSMGMGYGTTTSHVPGISYGLDYVSPAFDYKSDGYLCYHDAPIGGTSSIKIQESYMKEFFNSLVDEINTPFEDKEKMPLVAQANGHAFVVDGYMTGGYVNINFGWEENKGSGWYFISQLDPKIHGVHAVGGNYAMQYAIKGFVPAKSSVNPDGQDSTDMVYTDEGEFAVISGLTAHGEVEVYDQMGTKRGNYFANDSGIVRMYKRGLPSGIVIFKEVQSNRHKTVNL